MRYKLKLSGAQPGTNQIILPDEIVNHLGTNIAVWQGGRQVPAQVLQMGALNFDGNDYVTTPWSPSGSLSAVTFEAWVTLGSTPPDLSYWTIVGYASDTTEMLLRISVREAYSRDLFRYWVGSSFCETTTNTRPTVGELHHIAGSTDSLGTSRIFLDGIQEELVSGSPASTIVHAPHIGWSNVINSNQYWRGKIHEVRIWSTARTEDEIRRNMYRTLTGAEPGLEEYYRFLDGSGTTLSDATSNNRDATITGATWDSTTTYVTFLDSTGSTEIEIGTGTPLPFEPEAANSATVADWRPATGTYWYFPRSPFYDMKVKVAGAWKQVADMKVKIAGEWKEVTGVWHKQAGSWNKVGE